MAFGVGIGLFVLAAILLVAFARSEITNTWVLAGVVVVAAAIMSVYAVANFLDPSHIKTTRGECADDALSPSAWQEARAASDHGSRTREHARLVVRCDRLRGDTGTDVRALLGPPDRRTGTSAARTWIYTAGGDDALSIRFVGGREVSAEAAPG